jgi:hypothetical protein
VAVLVSSTGEATSFCKGAAAVVTASPNLLFGLTGKCAFGLTGSGRRGPEGEVLQITRPVGTDERYASGAGGRVQHPDDRLALMADWHAMSAARRWKGAPS